MRKTFFSRIYIAITLIFMVIVFGTAGYMLVENLSFLDSLYMTIITMSTVGFKEVRAFSEGGRIFTIILITTNLGIFTYSITTLSAYFLDGEFRKLYKSLKVKNKISKLKDHVIICGYGRNGHQACRDMESHNIPYVVIENSEKVISELREKNILTINGDATVDQKLLEAGVYHARALITTLPTDADNVFVVLTARKINTGMKIISRATDESSKQKLRIAGADNVIMPEKIGGSHMASLVIKPNILEFEDIISGQGGPSVSFEELGFEMLSKRYRDKSIKDLDIRNLTGANIIGYKKPDGNYVINPPADIIIEPDSKIIVLGTSGQIQKLRQIFLG